MFLKLSNDINNVLFGQILPFMFSYQTLKNLFPREIILQGNLVY
jgi:hypothetical protein